MKRYHTHIIASTELEMDKHVYVYLPKDYETSNESYPVLYMHDGQNLFDDKLAYQNRGWRIMDLYETYLDLPKLIIVGIESDGMTRSNHLIPFKFRLHKRAKEIGGQADQYLAFLTGTVKPFIDQFYRTKPQQENTGIMGSSFGGVNTIYAAITYHNVFSRFGCISGAFHFSFFEPMMEQLEQTDFSLVQKLYMDTGTKETDDEQKNRLYMERNKEVSTRISNRLDPSCFQYRIIPEGRHHESDWEARLPEIIRFLFEE